MKFKKSLISFILVIAMAMSILMTGCGASPASTETTSEEKSTVADVPEDPSINPDTAQYWRETIQKYRDVDEVKQLFFVRYTGGCSAKAILYVKSEHNNAWEQKFETDAYVGKHGINKTKEGDAKTPVADLGVRSAFGILPNPGTSLEYIDITKNIYACDEDCEYYNQIIDIEKTGHDCKGEDMYAYSPEYNYGIATTFNDSNTYPDGSAIFIHCKGVKPFTGGCIAIDQEYMETLLKCADKNMRVVIAED